MQKEKTTIIKHYAEKLADFEARMIEALKHVLLSQEARKLDTYLGITSYQQIQDIRAEHVNFKYLAEEFDAYEAVFDVNSMPGIEALSSCYIHLRSNDDLLGIFEELNAEGCYKSFHVGFDVYFDYSCYISRKIDALADDIDGGIDMSLAVEWTIAYASEDFVGVPKTYIENLIKDTEHRIVEGVKGFEKFELITTTELLDKLKGVLADLSSDTELIPLETFRDIIYPACDLSRKLIRDIGFLEHEARYIDDEGFSIVVWDSSGIDTDATVVQFDSWRTREIAALLINSNWFDSYFVDDYMGLLDLRSCGFMNSPSYHDMVKAFNGWIDFDDLRICQREISQF